jgi:hypothetical protein
MLGLIGCVVCGATFLGGRIHAEKASAVPFDILS